MDWQNIIAYSPTQITCRGYRFLITMRPTDVGMRAYIQALKKNNVRVLVKVCDANYDIQKLTDNGIAVLDLTFADGQLPPKTIIADWFEVLRSEKKRDENACVAVHCMSGLGRASVLVAIALMELGWKYEHAVDIIRHRRRGAFNTRQLEFLKTYRRRRRLTDPSLEPCLLC